MSTDYESPVVEASWSALIELATCLGAYRGALVLVGGWVPYLLLRDHGSPDSGFKHVGSIDIDLVVDADAVDIEGNSTIEEAIIERGWTRSEERAFRFVRPVVSPADGRERDIGVDFLAAQPMDLGRRTESRRVQDGLLARVIEAAPIALEHRYEVDLSGELPGGGRVRTGMSMADVVGCIGMKGHALGTRYVEKDAYDIYAVLDHYGGGPVEVAGAIRPFLDEPLIRESLAYIGELFSTPRDAGPRWVADFFTTEMGEAGERRRQRAYQVVQAFLGGLD